MLWLCAFSGFFVTSEPAPYDILLVCAMVGWGIFGLELKQGFSPLVLLILLFMAGGLLSITQLTTYDRGPMYMAVSFFLASGAVFYAGVVAQSPDHLRPIVRGYTAAAVIAALAGIIGYFGLLPGAETFTLYGRARGTFEDPNVFGPFLVFPLATLTYTVLTARMATRAAAAMILLVLLIGVLLSFSRATWALAAFVMAATGLIVFINERSALKRLRLTGLAMTGIFVLALALAAALSLDSVSSLFTERASLLQDYDSSRMGRFARHAAGFLLAAKHPLGIGPLEFYKIFTEDPHNVYLKAFIAYGWLGGISFIVLTFWTLAALFPLIFKPRPWTPIAIATFVTLFGHDIMGLVIDMDHWRHLFLLYGLAWGLIALEAHRGEMLDDAKFIHMARTSLRRTRERARKPAVSERSAAW
ncbi:O-antigen ligase family protein [Breoghania sp. L-A4]|uniref:O-antigen ligase family protein n=1 Tax=Breoghania sp. L-A4 TaxID=2304600 RepID=UPI000E35ACED|nr:O-antigen ligase family protein [Breoghania sp. L-A4]AXS40970.1 O-antigen ligase domain-containing protein [Breoghania sp. L-A4]